MQGRSLIQLVVLDVTQHNGPENSPDQHFANKRITRERDTWNLNWMILYPLLDIRGVITTAMSATASKSKKKHLIRDYLTQLNSKPDYGNSWRIY
ncbi:predicted protein [Sclerotinia sclerotiorum 1980 UF-70]|uniref:Uncharacterized protein n=1 Tax=Sclerotinia sclerotiorum (strain ATCC 18683 / 1980 / Ss-1) TaxID=665079 RepID=A7EEC2_SCLS1|nr:predicted protein [Sclerotinia sclerotiorum 1980 UF-70]EDO01188.1 predicted protein [Sclerotinia sclerotiorum 1980 UF-70]